MTNDSDTTEVRAEAEPAQAKGESFFGTETTSVRTDAPDSVGSDEEKASAPMREDVGSKEANIRALAGALRERLSERNEIRESEPTATVDASVRPDVPQSSGMVEIFDDDADEDRIQRFHELDQEIAQLLLDNQQLVIDVVDDWAISH